MRRTDRLCPMHSLQQVSRSPVLKHFDADDQRPGPVEDEHLAIFTCSGYVSARKAFQDFFAGDIATVGPCSAQRDYD